MGTSGKMVPKVLIPQKAIKQCQYKVRGMLGPRTTNESFSAKILALNRLIRGWCAYYRSTSSPQWGFREVERKLIWDMALARKEIQGQDTNSIAQVHEGNTKDLRYQNNNIGITNHV